MLLTDRNAKTVLAARLQPGETLLHHAYGVTQPARPVLILMYIFCVVLPAALLIRRLTKHFLVGLSDRQLIVLRFKDLANPEEVWAYDRATLRASGTEGILWSHLDVADQQRPFRAKFHRAAMPHNRAEMHGILAALTAAAGLPGATP